MSDDLTIKPVAAQPSVPGLDGFVRLSGTAKQVAVSLGPLADLVGTWVGNHGWNMIAVPDGSAGFKLLVRPYIETITFTPLGAPIPDRGGEVGTLLLTGLQYDLRVTDAETNQPLHFENGMWLLLNQNAESPSIARHTVVPHGNSLAAFGTFSQSAGAPQIPDINGIPDIGDDPLAGYLDVYMEPTPGFDKSESEQHSAAGNRPTNYLRDDHARCLDPEQRRRHHQHPVYRATRQRDGV